MIKEKYFRLHFFIRYISGKNGGCLYNMHDGKMIYIEEENNEKLKKAENNLKIDLEDKFFLELYEKNYGSFYDSPIFVDRMRIGASKEYEKINPGRVVVKEMFIQVTNDCKGGCEFCKPSGKIYTKTRCKKWENPEICITNDKWEETFASIAKVGCEKVSFIGGDPFLRFEKTKNLIQIAEKNGIVNFEIYSGLVDYKKEYLDYMRTHNITINAQIVSLKRNNKYTCVNGEFIAKSIMEIIEAGIELRASILLTRFNEEEVEEIVHTLKSCGVKKVELDYYYPSMKRDYSSVKYSKEIRNKQFISISKESIAFLERYNSCLYGKISVNLSGSITPCPMMNDYIIGNLAKEDILEVLLKPSYHDVVKLTRSKIDKCGECAFRASCVDCRAIESSASGKIDGVGYCEVAERIL